MKATKTLLFVIALGVVGAMTLVAWAGADKEEKISMDQAPQEKEQEREVTRAEVPAAALAALKKLAAGAEFTEFAEEIKHGHTFYEGS